MYLLVGNAVFYCLLYLIVLITDEHIAMPSDKHFINNDNALYNGRLMGLVLNMGECVEMKAFAVVLCCVRFLI